MANFTVQIDTPCLSAQEYARRTGTTLNQVRRMIYDGRLPVMPKRSPKETPFINMIALAKAAADIPFVAG